MTDPLIHLGWLPTQTDWAGRLDRARKSEPKEAAKQLIELANTRLDFVQTTRLDRAVQQFKQEVQADLADTAPVRLAVLGSCTLTHLLPAIRIGALRRRLWVDFYEGPYGTYRQELQDRTSGLFRFKPDVVLFAMDSLHLLGAEGSSVESALGTIRDCWRLAKQSLGCAVLQQTALPTFPALLGNNEHRYLPSTLAQTWRLNERLRELADTEGAHLLAVHEVASRDGLSEWYDETLWHQSKQEIHPRVSPAYGDQVARLLAAVRGKSYKCLVVDLDNTLWGGVIGDDGLAGITLGQGSALGEAFLAFQRYALALSHRGVILAVCSKNDEATALEVFDKHPEMLLRRKDIACFVANWDDKPSNLRAIAKRLNIGIDSLVFADDNPFERNFVRTELPEVGVPELPEDPADYARCVAAAGYFEGVSVTAEDHERNAQYQANAERETLRDSAADIGTYLRSLNMELQYAPFSQVGLSRIVQLINKTNQFNLTTRRYTEPTVQALLADKSALHLQFRLIDRFGDNGVIALVIGRLESDHQLVLDTWLMSCRVLGRQVESATLNVLVSRAKAMGARAIIGQYLPTAKNGMVKDHYAKLGFEPLRQINEQTAWRLDLTNYSDQEVPMELVEGTS